MTGLESFNNEKLSGIGRNSFNPDKLSDEKFDFNKKTEGFNPDKLSDEKFDFSENKAFDIKELKENYLDDLCSKSEYPQTIDREKAMCEKWEKALPEDTQAKRADFSQQKWELRQLWEQETGRPWPTYTKDIYDNNGNLIRKKGMMYDAHHIQPLEMGGKNLATNLTPLSADVHYDHKGVHALGSPYDILSKEIRRN